MFTCWRCGVAYEVPEDWTDQDAVDATVRLLGPGSAGVGDDAVLCEPCWQEFVEWAQQEGLIQGRETQ